MRSPVTDRQSVQDVLCLWSCDSWLKLTFAQNILFVASKHSFQLWHLR